MPRIRPRQLWIRNCHTKLLFHNVLFKLNVLGWHSFIGSYTFRVYIARIHDLYITLRAHHPRSSPLPSPRIWPPFLPSGNHHTVLCVYGFQFYIPHMRGDHWKTEFICKNCVLILACVNFSHLQQPLHLINTPTEMFFLLFKTVFELIDVDAF